MIMGRELRERTPQKAPPPRDRVNAPTLADRSRRPAPQSPGRFGQAFSPLRLGWNLAGAIDDRARDHPGIRDQRRLSDDGDQVRSSRLRLKPGATAGRQSENVP